MNFRLNTALIAGLALFMAACSDDEFTGEPQVRPQLPTMPVDGVALAQGDGAATAVNLGTLVADGGQVKVADITELKDFPSSEYNLVLELQLAKDGDAAFAGAKTLSTEIIDNGVYVPAQELQDAVTELSTKDPRHEVKLLGRFAAFAKNDASNVRLGGEDAWLGPFTYRLMPAQPYTIDDAYYLVGNFNNWTASEQYKLAHSDVNVYDDPLFSYVLEVDEAMGATGVIWKVLPGAYINSENPADHFLGIEVSETNPADGAIVAGPGSDATLAGAINGEGRRMITLNMEKLTSLVTYAFDRLWAPGAGTSTSDFNKVQQLYTTDYMTYNGMAALRGNWWLTGQPSQKGVNFVQAAETEPVTEGLVTKGHIESSSTASPKMQIDKTKALYWISANLVQYTYDATKIETLGLVGGFNGWNEKENIELTPDKSCMVWTINDLVIEENTELKFNANKAWDISFGPGATGATRTNDNFSIEAGTYDITIDFAHLDENNCYAVTFTKK